MHSGKKYKRSVLVVAALHVLVWGMLFSFPLLFGSVQQTNYINVHIRTWVLLSFSAIIFYVNYFFLVNRLLFKEKFGAFFVVNLAIFTACLSAGEWLKTFFPLPPPQPGLPPHVPDKTFLYFRDSLSFLLTSGISVAIRATQRWYKTESEMKEMENERLRSEISHLRYQLQPHFFFNSLNNIYSLIDSSPENAKEAIHGLSKLMRYLLYETKVDTVPLGNEVEFLKKYIALMQLRVTDKVDVQIDFPANVPARNIAPLLFIPLVENAFKHGISACQPSFIYIGIKIEKNTVFFKSENGNFPKNGHDVGGSGIGLVNLKKRLELLYPDSFSFRQREHGKTYITELQIALQ